MTQSKEEDKTIEYRTKTTLILVFVGALLAFIGYMTFFGPGWQAFRLGWLDLVLLSFAVFRLGHLVSYDRVMEPLRRPFTETLPDPTGSGETVEARGTGVRQSIGQLICCPICVGTWISAGLVYLLYLWPDPVRVFLTMSAAVGAAEMLNAGFEAWQWTGQNQRTQAGTQMLSRRRNVVHIEQAPCLDQETPEQKERSASTYVRRRVAKRE